MNYSEGMEFLNNAAMFGMNFGLDRTKEILKNLDNPHEKVEFIHVGGTNGKGSTTAMLSNILISAGYNVGMYTSPYIEEFEERIQINNVNISKEALSEVLTEVKCAIDKIDEEKFGEPTYFEIVTCAAFLYFYKKNVDLVVLEVGLGGRLDSTNVINPKLCIITSISFDHMNILGNSLQEISREKAGIIKENIPLVLYPVNEECRGVIKEVCKEKNSKLIEVENCSELLETVKGQNNNKPLQKARITTNTRSYDVELALLGEHQITNCSVVLHAVEELINMGYKVNEEHILEGLKNVRWPGRLESLKNKPLVVIDGAHNLGGIEALSSNIKKYYEYNEMVLIMGILGDKEVENIIRRIVPLAKKVITVTPNNKRAENNVELKSIIEKYNKDCKAIDDYKEAYLEGLNSCNENDMLLISGSLYMIGDMRRIIRENNEV